MPLNRYHPWGFRLRGLGPVEAHVTFSLKCFTQDLYLFTEGSDLMATAEESGRHRCVDPNPHRGGNDPVEGAARGEEVGGISARAATETLTMATTLPDHRAREEGVETEAFTPSRLSTSGRRYDGRKAIAGVIDETRLTTTLQLTESEAWDRVAREVRFEFNHLYTNYPCWFSYTAPRPGSTDFFQR